MPDFQWVKAPVFTPTYCGTCMAPSDRKGFVDLLVDNPVVGRAYMCASCVEQAGRKVGMLPKDQAERMVKSLADKDREIADLQKKLADETQNKQISLKDAKKLLGV